MAGNVPFFKSKNGVRAGTSSWTTAVIVTPKMPNKKTIRFLFFVKFATHVEVPQRGRQTPGVVIIFSSEYARYTFWLLIWKMIVSQIRNPTVSELIDTW